MNVFFTSDTHFGHKNIIDYCARPFSSVEEMDEALVENWNETVKPNDVVWHLGDWAFNNYHHLGRLNGIINTVPGNHDFEGRQKKIAPYLNNGKNIIHERIHFLKCGDHKFTLCHFPFDSWDRRYNVHLHGHMHGTGGVRSNRLDVGMDAVKIYRPVEYTELVKLIDTNNIWAMEMNQ
jgi:calcineurin-like phosphoesterase family protein